MRPAVRHRGVRIRETAGGSGEDDAEAAAAGRSDGAGRGVEESSRVCTGFLDSPNLRPNIRSAFAPTQVHGARLADLSPRALWVRALD